MDCIHIHKLMNRSGSVWNERAEGHTLLAFHILSLLCPGPITYKLIPETEGSSLVTHFARDSN